MKIGFYAFTGTGNTRRVCGMLAEELQNIGVNAEVNLIRAGQTLPDPEEYDAVVAAFPVHGFNLRGFCAYRASRSGSTMPRAFFPNAFCRRADMP